MDDLISRAAAIDAIVSVTAFPDAEYIKNLCQNPAISEDWLGGVCDAINAVEDVNAVDAVPVVHGRWVKMMGMMPPEYHGHYECSECQWHMKGLRNSWTREEEMTYCPNCGAKMDGDTDG